MSTLRAGAARILCTIGLGAVFVATPLPVNVAAFAIWVILVARWVHSQALARGPCAGAAKQPRAIRPSGSKLEVALEVGALVSDPTKPICPRGKPERAAIRRCLPARIVGELCAKILRSRCFEIICHSGQGCQFSRL